MPRLLHICFFEDDSFLFFNATQQKCYKVNECLNIYERASGRIINFQKSFISFSRNTQDLMKEEICVFLNVNVTVDHGCYLGLPSIIGKNKKVIFSFVKHKAWRKIQGWLKKALSKAGKEILLKTVVQAIPTYVMSVFLLPLSLCMELKE